MVAGTYLACQMKGGSLSRRFRYFQPGWMKDSGTMLGGNFLSQYTSTCACYSYVSLFTAIHSPPQTPTTSSRPSKGSRAKASLYMPSVSRSVLSIARILDSLCLTRRFGRTERAGKLQPYVPDVQDLRVARGVGRPRPPQSYEQQRLLRDEDYWIRP